MWFFASALVSLWHQIFRQPTLWLKRLLLYINVRLQVMRSATQPAWGDDGAAVMSARTVDRIMLLFGTECRDVPPSAALLFLMLKSLLISSVELEPWSLWQNARCVRFIFIREIRRDKIKLLVPTEFAWPEARSPSCDDTEVRTLVTCREASCACKSKRTRPFKHKPIKWKVESRSWLREVSRPPIFIVIVVSLALRDLSSSDEALLFFL